MVTLFHSIMSKKITTLWSTPIYLYHDHKAENPHVRNQSRALATSEEMEKTCERTMSNIEDN